MTETEHPESMILAQRDFYELAMLHRRKIFGCMLLASWKGIETDSQMFRMELLARVPWIGSKGVFDLAVPKGIACSITTGNITILHPGQDGGFYHQAGHNFSGASMMKLMKFMQLEPEVQLYAWTKFREVESQKARKIEKPENLGKENENG